MVYGQKSLIAKAGSTDLGFIGNPVVVYGPISLIDNPNPNEPGFNDLGSAGNPIIFNNKLYFQYQNSSGKFQLAVSDGNSVNLIDNPSPTDDGFAGNAIVFNSKL